MRKVRLVDKRTNQILTVDEANVEDMLKTGHYEKVKAQFINMKNKGLD